ncbi:MAG: fasciclin domain-containing protein [Acidobacteriota bacterium]
MPRRRTLVSLALASTLVLTAATASAGGCSSSKNRRMSARASHSMMTSGKDIVATAAAAGSFETLLAAATTAGLVDALKADGPITVFAPTDDAFAKLPVGTVESLLRPENRERLTAILTYHVVPGRVPASEVVEAERVATLNGQRPAVTVARGDVRIGQAKVVSTDIAASNGIIHVIDSVLLPSENDVVTTAVEAGSFGTLAAALQAADLVGALRGDGPFTVFAPTDAAFADLPEGALAELLETKNVEKLREILTFHVVPGRIYSDDILAGAELDTLQGRSLKAELRGGAVRIGDAKVVTADLETTNGVIHVLDGVLMPGGDDRRAALDLIEGAISRGAPLYNHGHPGACTAVYETAASALVTLPGNALSSEERSRLQRAMRESRHSHGDRNRAWVMREALDDVARSIARTM